MNLVVAFMLVLITLLCLILIPNKLIAIAIILSITILLILIRPHDFKSNDTHELDNSENTCVSENNK